MCWTPSPAVLTDLGGGVVGWWNPRTGHTKSASLDPPSSLDRLTMSRDGRLVAACGRGQGIQFRSMASLALEQECAGHRGGQAKLVFSPDAKTLASMGNDRTVKLWDVATGEELLTLGGFEGNILHHRFSPDGKVLATISEKGAAKVPLQVRLWLAADD